MKMFTNDEIRTREVTQTVFVPGWGFGNWFLLVSPIKGGIELRFTNGNKTIEVKNVYFTKPSVVSISSKRAGWKVRVLDEDIYDASVPKFIDVRVRKNLPAVLDYDKAYSEAYEPMGGPWFRINSFTWVEPIDGFETQEAVKVGFHRGWNLPGDGLEHISYEFSTTCAKNKILEFLNKL